MRHPSEHTWLTVMPRPRSSDLRASEPTAEAVATCQRAGNGIDHVGVGTYAERECTKKSQTLLTESARFHNGRVTKRQEYTSCLLVILMVRVTRIELAAS